MGLFVKKQFNDSRQLYTLSTSKNKLIVGLGNVGPEYKQTRHNIGFEAVDAFVTKQEAVWRERKDLKCLLADVRLSGTRVLIIKPTTFMNNSGEAVEAVQQFYKIHPNDTTIIHDELDIPFGQIRVRKGGGSAGHNGIKSLIEKGNENTTRIRVGVGPKLHSQQDSADFVLGKFSSEQMEKTGFLLKEVLNILSEILFTEGDVKPETRTFLT